MPDFMAASHPSKRHLSSLTVEPAPNTVVLGLIDGMDDEGLADLFVALWHQYQFRVTLDCSHLNRLTAAEARTLMRYACQFSAHGGFVRLTRANGRVRSLLEVLHCAELLAPDAGAESREAR